MIKLANNVSRNVGVFDELLIDDNKKLISFYIKLIWDNIEYQM